MFTVKGKTESRKVTVMDFKKARMITFFVNELEGEEMDGDLKEYMHGQLGKVNTGYWDYTGKDSTN
jgi:hypothetical protein